LQSNSIDLVDDELAVGVKKEPLLEKKGVKHDCYVMRYNMIALLHQNCKLYSHLLAVT
jgi:hypothetical protein